MGNKTEISWTDATWNPVTGCTPVSPGCEHCYAARYSKRGIGDFGNKRQFSEVRIHPERLGQPMRWRKPRKIFVCSMGDLFHESVPSGFIGGVYNVIQRNPWHIFQILTKRPKRMLELLGSGYYSKPLPNLWLGVTAENQAMADERIPLLLQTPAAVRFVSVEPMLGPVNLMDIPWHPGRPTFPETDDLSDGRSAIHIVEGKRIDWVICGGETGPGARPMHPDWARLLRDQCVAAGVLFHFKHWGEWAPVTHYDQNDNPLLCISLPTEKTVKPGDKEIVWQEGTPVNMLRVGKKAAGRLLDGREWNEFPEVAK
jgi:protein gp37